MRVILEGTYEEIQRDALRLFGPAPVIETVIRDETPSLTETMNADTMAAIAPEIAQDAPETAGEETVAPQEETAENASEAKKTASAEEPAKPQPEITMVEARERMNALRQAHGAKAVKAVLSEIGYPKFTDVPQEKYADLMVLCDAADKGFADA